MSITNYIQKLHIVVSKVWLYRWLRLVYRNQLLLKPILKKQLINEACFTKAIGEGPRIFIPLIETSHYQYYQILIIAKALVLRGAQVKILLCGSQLDGCEVKSTRHTKIDPCLTCRFNHRLIVPEFGLNVCSLDEIVNKDEVVSIRCRAEEIVENYPLEYIYKGVDIIPMTNDSVTRYYYGAVPYASVEKLKIARARYLISAMIGVEAAQSIDREWKPDILFNNMNVYCDWGPYYSYFEQKGIQINTVSLTPSNYHAIVFNLYELFSSDKRYKQWEANRKSLMLNSDEQANLQNFMLSRFSGGAKVFENYGFFDKNVTVEDIIKIDRKKRNLFLFANVFWDVGLSERFQLYRDVISWVLATIELLKDQNDCHLYIKPHPAEVMGTPSLKSLVDFINEKYPKLSDNITIIYPELKINTYDLFPYIDLGIVYNGTLGLEMLLSNIPVVACGKAAHGGLGLIAEPRTEVDYRDMLISGMGLVSPNKQKAELFAYFYFIKSFIPWTLTEQAFSNDFKGFAIQTLDDLLPSKNKYLDHLCDCILKPDSTIVEDWI